jgi:DNA-binding NarL/FixJ family response regulator
MPRVVALPPALLDVLAGAARGESIADTARRRVVSPETVRDQWRHIYDRTEAPIRRREPLILVYASELRARGLV